MEQNSQDIEIIKPYVIAIPSYKRVDTLLFNTLKTLYSHRISATLIYIFLANKTEYADYHNAYTDPVLVSEYKISDGYRKYLQRLNFIIGLKGLRNQRNYISRYFAADQNIVFLDDDIKDILELKQYTSSITQSARRQQALGRITDLHKFFLSAFQFIRKHGAYIWGVYPVANPYFMTPHITSSLKFIVGPMYGIVNRHLASLKLTTDEKENVERTLQYFTLDGKVIRFNNITIQTNYFTNPGGMQANLADPKAQRMAAALEAAQYLHQKYPEITKIFTDKKSGWPELKLKKTGDLAVLHITRKTIDNSIVKTKKTKPSNV